MIDWQKRFNDAGDKHDTALHYWKLGVIMDDPVLAKAAQEVCDKCTLEQKYATGQMIMKGGNQ